jgi:hypothetical protein
MGSPMAGRLACPSSFGSFAISAAKAFAAIFKSRHRLKYFSFA